MIINSISRNNASSFPFRTYESRLREIKANLTLGVKIHFTYSIVLLHSFQTEVSEIFHCCSFNSTCMTKLKVNLNQRISRESLSSFKQIIHKKFWTKLIIIFAFSVVLLQRVSLYSTFYVVQKHWMASGRKSIFRQKHVIRVSSSYCVKANGFRLQRLLIFFVQVSYS